MRVQTNERKLPQARDRPSARYSIPRSAINRRSDTGSRAPAAPQRRDADPMQQLLLWASHDDICCNGYTRLSDNPEIQTGCLRIAELVGTMPVHIYENTDEGDKRVENELSRALDITPNGNMNRSQWMIVNVMNTLLYGRGNGICVPHTRDGYLESMEPIAAARVNLQPVPGSYREYRVLIDGIPRDPAQLMHFVYNPDPLYLWQGQGMTVTLRDLANNLKQAQATENAFMSSEWKPSIIVKVDALADEFSSPEGRQRLLDSYVKPALADPRGILRGGTGPAPESGRHRDQGHRGDGQEDRGRGAGRPALPAGRRRLPAR